MERKSYSYGAKMAVLLLHLFFTVILTVSVFLLVTLMDKEILEWMDIGTTDFLNSGYYTQCVQEKCDNLSDYLHLKVKGESCTPEENRRYLQYANEFEAEYSNFCYWYKLGDVWYTNQPDAEEGQAYDTDAVLLEARSMGNYLIYDMENKVFHTDVRGLANYFFESYNTQLYWPTENVVLIIGIDTQLTAQDDLYDASIEYQKLHPWIKVAIGAGLLSMMGWIVTLVYLTLAAGRHPEDTEIHLTVVDRVKTEILVAGFVLITCELILLIARLNNQEWEVSGLLVASGTVSLVMDALFLLFYLSIVRLMKAERLWENSITYWLGRGIKKTIEKWEVTARVLVLFGAHLIVCFLLVWGIFRKESIICLILLSVFLAGECYLLLRTEVETNQVLEGVKRIRDGDLSYKLDSEELHGDSRLLAESINNVGDGLVHAVDDSIKNERMKADLITNVSHDIKTPLTSIINYVNLIKREQIENERVQGYIKILDEKSQRLKQLTEDLVEASKVSSGNVKLNIQMIDLVELVCQTAGEFNEKFEQKDLTIVTKLPKSTVFIMADGRQLYRVIENLYNNVAKYAMEKTRVYVEVTCKGEDAMFSIKNVSEKSLALENGAAGDLTERFVRGDSSRTTEGSGLGLSIAKNLTTLMGGRFDISVDGDLFRATITFHNFTEEKAEDDAKTEVAEVGADDRAAEKKEEQE